MKPPEDCALCGNDRRHEVRTVLVRWVEPVNGSIWDAILRCDDRVACRQRFEAKASATAAESGDQPEPWPLHDSDTEPPPPSATTPVEAAPAAVREAEPVAEPEPELPEAWTASSTFVDEPDEEMPWV